MPRINIKEDVLTTFAQFNATENSVLIPLFVTEEKLAGRYTTLNEFKRDFPTGEVELSQTVDTEGVFRATVTGGVVSYWTDLKERTGEQTTQYDEIVYFDKSYLMICELLSYGMTVVVKPILHQAPFTNEAEVVETIQTALSSAYADFKDKNLWNIKFVTSGAYPNAIYELTENNQPGVKGCYSGLRGVATNRKDCISLLEFERKLPFDVESTESSEDEPTLKKIVKGNLTGDDYEAAFYPWGVYNTNAAGLPNQVLSDMPACFGYLLAVAANAVSNSDWLANSGTIRGRVPNLSSLFYNVGESVMHFLQGDNDSSDNADLAVNPIMPVGTYGTRIWGNRTTGGIGVSDSYTNFLNVRILLCDIKKQIYHSSLRITFEPNDDIAWINFKKLNNTLLDQMQSGRGIQWYRWNKLTTDAKATLKALLTIKPIEALEYFDITVSLAEDGSASIEEVI